MHDIVKSMQYKRCLMYIIIVTCILLFQRALMVGMVRIVSISVTVWMEHHVTGRLAGASAAMDGEASDVHKVSTIMQFILPSDIMEMGLVPTRLHTALNCPFSLYTTHSTSLIDAWPLLHTLCWRYRALTS